MDALEGVCTQVGVISLTFYLNGRKLIQLRKHLQTITVLRQAWDERLKPILVINKIDRLITELQLAPIEAHHHLVQLVEQVNSVVGSFFAADRMEDEERYQRERTARLAARNEKNADSLIQQANTEATASNLDDNDEERNFEKIDDDEDIYFAPEKGDVIFASAYAGWAFRLDQFAHLHAVRLGLKESNLSQVLWGDFYLDPKTKRVLARKHLGKRNLKPMFVQFVLENLWAVYDSVIMKP